jgi:hypothetical protein
VALRVLLREPPSSVYLGHRLLGRLLSQVAVDGRIPFVWRCVKLDMERLVGILRNLTPVVSLRCEYSSMVVLVSELRVNSFCMPLFGRYPE